MNQLSQESSSKTNHYKRDLINVILLHSSINLPIKNADLLALVGINKSTLDVLLPVVINILETIYGITLRRVSRSGSGKRYVCCATAPVASMHELTKPQRAQRTLLFLILSFIYMRGGIVSERHLKKFLASFDIDYLEDHDYFGANIGKQIEGTFVKQLYLKRTKVQISLPNENAPEMCYSWGEHAELEYDKKEILEFVAKTLNQPIKHFVEQYQALNERD